MQSAAQGQSPVIAAPGVLAQIRNHEIWALIGDFLRAAGCLLELMLRRRMRSLLDDRLRSDRAREARRGLLWSGMVVALGGLLGIALLMPEAEPAASYAPPSVERLASGRAGQQEPLSPASPVPGIAGQATVGPPMVALPAETLWTSVKRPIPVFNVEAPQLDPAELTYQVSTRGRTARRDSLSWTPQAARPGAAGRPQIDLVIERHEQSLPTQKPLFAEIASRAAERHASLERMAPPGEIVTKFGAVQVADTMLLANDRLQACLVFRRVDMVGLMISGWYCAAKDKPVDRVTLGCFLDRLDLVSAGLDLSLKRYFAEAERSRTGCTSGRQPGRKTTWLDHEAPIPALKLSAKPR